MYVEGVIGSAEIMSVSSQQTADKLDSHVRVFVWESTAFIGTIVVIQLWLEALRMMLMNDDDVEG